MDVDAAAPRDVCPITQLVMRDPVRHRKSDCQQDLTLSLCPYGARTQVKAKDGHTYERKAIELWLVDHDTSPLTGVRLASKSLTPVAPA